MFQVCSCYCCHRVELRPTAVGSAYVPAFIKRLLDRLDQKLGQPLVRRIWRLRLSTDPFCIELIESWSRTLLAWICVPAVLYELTNAPVMLVQIAIELDVAPHISKDTLPPFALKCYLLLSRGFVEGVLAFAMLSGISLLIPPVPETDISRPPCPGLDLFSFLD